MFFTALSKECVGSKFYRYERKDNIHLSDYLNQKNIMQILSQIQNLWFNNYLIIKNNLFWVNVLYIYTYF